MLPRRYSVVIADLSSGAERRLHLPVRPVVAVVGAVVTLPILIGLGAAWKAKAEVATLFSEYQSLQLENANYRQATEALSGQIDSLQRAVSDLGARSALDPALAGAMEKLPALVKAKAMGGSSGTPPAAEQRSYAKTLTALANPEDTFRLCCARCSKVSTAACRWCGARSRSGTRWRQPRRPSGLATAG
jgi:hypothetical protein